MAFYSNVNTQVRGEDEGAIKIILGTEDKPILNTYDDEIRVIRWAQARVFEVAPGMTPIPDYSDREPLDLLKAKSGLCYDRSRTLDKTLTWLGFQTRHVYILFADRGDETNVWQFAKHMFTYSNSHAVTEVKTSRGWLTVGSNSLWISLARDGRPIPAGEIYERRTEFENPPEYVAVPFWAIRGMYSRKGQLYRPYIYFPEFNWANFMGWAFGFD